MIPPPHVAAYLARLTLWASTFLVGAFLVCNPDSSIELAAFGMFLASAIGGPGIVLDRPNQPHRPAT